MADEESSCAGEYFVSNLPYDVTEEELKDFFKPTCEVTHCRLKRTKLGITSCHAYIQFGGSPNGVAVHVRREKLKGRQLCIEAVGNENDEGEDGEEFPPWKQSQRDGRHNNRVPTKQQRDEQAKRRIKWNPKKVNEKIEIINKKGIITKQGHAILNNMHMYDVVLLIKKMQQLVRLSPQAAIKILSNNQTVYYSLIHALFLLGILNIEMNPLSEEEITRMKFHSLKNKFQFLCVESEEEGEADALAGQPCHPGGAGGYEVVRGHADRGEADWGASEWGASEWRDADRGAANRGDANGGEADPGEVSDGAGPPWGGQNHNYEQSGRRQLYDRGGGPNAVNMGTTSSSMKHLRGKNQPVSNRKNASRGVYSTNQGASYGGNHNSYASINHLYVPSDEGQSGYPGERDSAFGEMEKEAVKGGRANLVDRICTARLEVGTTHRSTCNVKCNAKCSTPRGSSSPHSPSQ